MICINKECNGWTESLGGGCTLFTTLEVEVMKKCQMHIPEPKYDKGKDGNYCLKVTCSNWNPNIYCHCSSYSPFELEEGLCEGYDPVDGKPKEPVPEPPKGEFDASGKLPSEPGAKLDGGKVKADEVIREFSRALMNIIEIGDEGAKKYSMAGWVSVPDGINRYLNAKKRHELKRQSGEWFDHDSGQLHLAHEVWNGLAALELLLRSEEDTNGKDE